MEAEELLVNAINCLKWGIPIAHVFIALRGEYATK